MTLAAAIVAVLLTALLAYVLLQEPDTNEGAKNSIAAIIDTMKHQSVADPAAMRLKSGLTPPTNKWFSGLVFSKEPVPIFATPLSYRANAAGFEVGLPSVSATADTIFAPHIPALRVTTDTSEHQVETYDDLSVVDGHLSDGNVVMSTRITQGSPFIFSQLSADEHITVSGQRVSETGPGQYLAEGGTARFGVNIVGASSSLSGDTIEIRAGENATVTLFAIPDGADAATYFNTAQNVITGSSVSYERKGETMVTRYELQTENGAETLFASLPHQQINGDEALGAFTTLYGTADISKGSVFESTAQLEIPALQLGIKDLSDAEKTELSQSLAKETAALQFTKDDTYFGGKELYRAANLLMIADALGAEEEKETLRQELHTVLETWLDPQTGDMASSRYFYFDDRLKGVVGIESSFGSEDFNDHHFHYGYFIYAAAVLGRHDEAFLRQHQDIVNVLINDIASDTTDEYGVRMRAFDMYHGHSWASGYADFGDGNNQESSSEAVNAWYAMYLWSKVTDDAELAEKSLWLYSQESTSALLYWLSDKAIPAEASAYEHEISVLNWSGKRDYATFFSPRPQAKLGIQLIPMSPGHRYLGQNEADRIKRQLEKASPDDKDFNGQFGDYLLMYMALVDAQRAQTLAADLPASAIDDANSRTYLQAWLMVAANKDR